MFHMYEPQTAVHEDEVVNERSVTIPTGCATATVPAPAMLRHTVFVIGPPLSPPIVGIEELHVVLKESLTSARQHSTVPVGDP